MELALSLQLLPDAALQVVILELDIKSLASLAETEMRDFLSDPYILEQLSLKHKLPITKSLDQFLEYSEMEPEDLVLLSAGRKDMRVVDGVIENSFDPDRLIAAVMAIAARIGNIEVVRLMLDQGIALVGDPLVNQTVLNLRDYNWTMVNAARGGHIDIVELMLSLGANDYNRTMAEAAGKGYIRIVQLMLDEDALDYDWALHEAQIGGHDDIVRLLIEIRAVDFSLI